MLFSNKFMAGPPQNLETAAQKGALDMKTAVIGFPRIGEKRELKFASEQYFKGEISEKQLLDIAAGIRGSSCSSRRIPELISFPRMTFLFTITYWTPQIFLASFRTDIGSWDFPLWIPILRWREVIRA